MMGKTEEEIATGMVKNDFIVRMSPNLPIKVMPIEKHRARSIAYRFACDCGDAEDDIHIDFEFDEESGVVWVTLYKKLQYSDWWAIGYDHWWQWFQRMWRRIKGALRLLFIGTIELESEMIIGSKEHIDSLIWILEEGKKYFDTTKDSKIVDE